MKHVVLNTKTKQFQTYLDSKTGKKVRLELPSAEHAQHAAEYLTRRCGFAFFARTTEA